MRDRPDSAIDEQGGSRTAMTGQALPKMDLPHAVVLRMWQNQRWLLPMCR
jgi:hypothetical protein